ncbi:hypothetical protein J5N97_026999 [Dioscorea zingiberensis]|uniref:Uncharacterized protein n=1 Tax=Dioscorea zingiberensis TaxID=325984 RepID=A0A9D5C366_9LILI|nr:hypothetical protein J5N97_026999 [Dioscorea zingiberensis]
MAGTGTSNVMNWITLQHNSVISADNGMKAMRVPSMKRSLIVPLPIDELGRVVRVLFDLVPHEPSFGVWSLGPQLCGCAWFVGHCLISTLVGEVVVHPARAHSLKLARLDSFMFVGQAQSQHVPPLCHLCYPGE